MFKKLLVLAAVLAVLGAVGVFFLLRNLDSLVASGIEEVGSRAAQAPVSVESVHLRPAEGAGTITGLRVGNPEGFDTTPAFAFGAIDVEIDPKALTSDPVVIKKVTVERCDVNYEWSTGGSNIARIEENVAAFIEDLAPGGGGAAKAGSTKFVIQRLVIKDGRIAVSASFLRGRHAEAPLRRIVLNDVGGSDDGATSGEIAAAVLAALTGSVLESVAGLGIDGLDETGRLGGLLDAAGKLLEGIIGK